MSPARVLTVGPDDDDIRLDRWFRRHFPALGHGHLEKLLRTGQIRVDGGRAKASMRIAAGRAVRIPPGLDDKFARPGSRAPVSASDAEFLRGRVLYRDAGTIAIDKPAGLAVQGGSKVKSSVDAMLDALRFDADERPRLVHRLDKDTSGVLALARSRKAAAALVAAFREGRVEKEYWALVAGVPPRESGVVDLPLAKAPAPGGGESVRAGAAGAKRARTAWEVVAEARRVAWLSLRPETGRTHQIRVHCRALGTPIVGDAKYGADAARIDGPPPAGRLMLHARRLVLPGDGGGAVSVTAPLDAAMRAQWAFWGFDES